MQVRKSGGGTERRGQPRASCGANQPLVKEPIGGEILQTILAEVERGKSDQHTDERVDHVEAAVIRHLQTQVIELLVEACLGADRSGFTLVAGPAFDRVT